MPTRTTVLQLQKKRVQGVCAKFKRLALTLALALVGARFKSRLFRSSFSFGFSIEQRSFQFLLFPFCVCRFSCFRYRHMS